ncbi:MAG TPA: hypothetical protein IAB65_02935 [Candidatus Onthocola stercorigallinarum]|nr:hypothetical protein [Candidatus Onthocola stercorigallinarum]
MEEKKNKSLIIIIVILIILLIGSIGYIVYDNFIKEDEVVENNDNQNNNDNNNQDNEPNNEEDETNELSEEDEIAIIEDELGAIFSYINSEVDTSYFESENDWYLNSCMLLGTDMYKESDDVFQDIGPLIMDCYYDYDYPGFTNNLGGGALITDEQIADYKNYFESNFNFKTFTPLNPNDFQPQGEEGTVANEWYERIKAEYDLYNNKNYKIAYEYGDGFGVNPDKFEIIDIYPSGADYTAKVMVTMNDYEGTRIYNSEIKVQIIDGHCKFGIFKIG